MYQNLIIILLIQVAVFQKKSTESYFSMSDQDFFAQPNTAQLMSLVEPDTLLLDAAIFQATNKVRREHNLPLFRHDMCLYMAAKRHAASMILRGYYGHKNPFSSFERTVDKRVDLCTKRFKRMAENIGRYQTLFSGDLMHVRWNQRSHQYEFLDPDDNSTAQSFTYAAYAHHVVSQWMASPTHKSNILSDSYIEIGCAARLCQQPYNIRRAPYASLVQNFGNAN